MCGIVARAGTGDAVNELLSGLGNLEYRGYDSAGIAIQNGSGIEVYKRQGDIDRLSDAMADVTANGDVGIGHTRWSTHGAPCDENAHPHTDCEGRVAVVHNGIIDNYDELRETLQARGHVFTSDTDTEVIPHLVGEALDDGVSPLSAFRRAIDRLSGSYAVAVLVEGEDRIFAARHDSPLVVGCGDGSYFLASDVPAFIEHTDRVVHLENGDVATVTDSGFTVTDSDGERVDRETRTVDWDARDAGKSGYEHYMLKEIHEQPVTLRQTFSGRIDQDTPAVELEGFAPGEFADVERVHLVGMGTSYHAALYAETLFARRGIPARAMLASQYATDPPPRRPETLVVAVTQSGETADTLAAVRRGAANRDPTLAVTNVVSSTVTRECDHELFIRAGPEIGVAATKTFSSQVATLTLLGERLVDDRTGSHGDDVESLLESLSTLPRDVQRIVDESPAEAVARAFETSDAYFFIGRGPAHPVALEGALKFKEITYEHAEGFAAAELKHGPLALVAEDTPVFAVFTGRDDDATTLGNVEEARARDAPVVAVAPESATDVHEHADHVLSVPDTHPEVVGVLANVHLQLVAYHAATLRGLAIDKPRNLAKSVTVQ